MRKLPRKFRDPLIFLCILIAVPSSIYLISMNFGDQRVHIEKKQWNPASAADQGVNPHRLKKADEHIEARLPLARGMVIIKNGKTIHEKYYWKGGPLEKEFLHSLNGPVLHALVGIAIEKQMLTGPDQLLANSFPEYFPEGSLPMTIADLLKTQAPLIWGEGAPEYWELFYAGDRIGAAIKTLSTVSGKPDPAANFAANFLLAEVLQAATSMNVFKFADQYLFSPMGITTLAETKEKGGMLDPFIGFELKTLDLAKFGYLIMQEGTWQDKEIISSDWVQMITGKLRKKPETGFWGSWQLTRIGNTESLISQGESGQYIVLVPELDLLIAVSSTSLFPLSENSGYDHLFKLIFKAADKQLIAQESVYDPDNRPYYEPNFVYATEVPEDIRQFFHDLAKDIATQDINRILYHYAKGYEKSGDDILLLDKLFLEGDDYREIYGYWKKIFFGGTGELEFVQIEKLRIDGNRAYLRGSLKYSYANMNEGSFGLFPLENLIKLRGRWLWFGSPDYGDILDRDEYFDAEIPVDIQEFVDECGLVLTGASEQNQDTCFSGNFMYSGLQQPEIQELLKPLWKGDREAKIHITRATESGGEGLLQGYIENSLIGTISLPPGMKIVKHENMWKWSGNGNE